MCVSFYVCLYFTISLYFSSQGFLFCFFVLVYFFFCVRLCRPTSMLNIIGIVVRTWLVDWASERDIRSIFMGLPKSLFFRILLFFFVFCSHYCRRNLLTFSLNKTKNNFHTNTHLFFIFIFISFKSFFFVFYLKERIY